MNRGDHEETKEALQSYLGCSPGRSCGVKRTRGPSPPYMRLDLENLLQLSADNSAIYSEHFIHQPTLPVVGRCKFIEFSFFIVPSISHELLGRFSLVRPLRNKFAAVLKCRDWIILHHRANDITVLDTQHPLGITSSLPACPCECTATSTR